MAGDYFLAYGVNGQHIISGQIAEGYRVRAYLAGTSTTATIYRNHNGVTLAQPVAIGALGFPENAIFIARGIAYDFALETPGGVTVKLFESVTAGAEGTATGATEFSQTKSVFVSARDAGGNVLGIAHVGDLRGVVSPGIRIILSGNLGAIIRYATVLRVVHQITESQVTAQLDSPITIAEYNSMLLGNNTITVSMLHPLRNTVPGRAYKSGAVSPSGDLSFVSGGRTNVFPIAGMVRLSVGYQGLDINGLYPCSGQTLSRTGQSLLFGAIGTTFGAGDGSTTYTLPNVPENPDDSWYIYAAQ